MGTYVGEVYMALIWDLHGLGRIFMGFLSSYTANETLRGGLLLYWSHQRIIEDVLPPGDILHTLVGHKDHIRRLPSQCPELVGH